MAEKLPTIPLELQPDQKDFSFDIDRALAGIVGLRRSFRTLRSRPRPSARSDSATGSSFARAVSC